MNSQLDDIPSKANVARREHFSRNLRRILADRNWNQSDLARRASENMPDGKVVSKQTVSHFVNGLNLPSQRAMLALAKALGVSPSELDPAPEVSWLEVEARDALDSRSKRTPSAPKPVLSMDSLDGMACLNLNVKIPVADALKIMEILKNAGAE